MEYRKSDLEYLEVPYKDFVSYSPEDISLRFRTVIEDEGPVVDDFLELKVLKSYGIEKRGSLIAPFLRGILLDLGAVTTVQTDCDGEAHYVFWPESYRGHEIELEKLSFPAYSGYRPSGRREEMEEGTFRAISDLPHVEIFNAMRDVLSSGESLRKDVFFTRTNNALGFTVKGRQIRGTLELVLKKGIENKTFIYSRRAGTIRM